MTTATPSKPTLPGTLSLGLARGATELREFFRQKENLIFTVSLPAILMLLLGTVYVTMRRLEKKGLIRSWLGDPTAERGGKAKRFYAVEPAGVEALHAAQAALGRMWKELPPKTGRA